MPTHPDKKNPLLPSKVAPRWVRYLLMVGLIALCAVGFYFSNAASIERFMNR